MYSKHPLLSDPDLFKEFGDAYSKKYGKDPTGYYQEELENIFRDKKKSIRRLQRMLGNPHGEELIFKYDLDFVISATMKISKIDEKSVYHLIILDKKEKLGKSSLGALLFNILAIAAGIFSAGTGLVFIVTSMGLAYNTWEAFNQYSGYKIQGAAYKARLTEKHPSLIWVVAAFAAIPFDLGSVFQSTKFVSAIERFNVSKNAAGLSNLRNDLVELGIEEENISKIMNAANDEIPSPIISKAESHTTTRVEAEASIARSAEESGPFKLPTQKAQDLIKYEKPGPMVEELKASPGSYHELIGTNHKVSYSQGFFYICSPICLAVSTEGYNYFLTRIGKVPLSKRNEFLNEMLERGQNLETPIAELAAHNVKPSTIDEKLLQAARNYRVNYTILDLESFKFNVAVVKIQLRNGEVEYIATSNLGQRLESLYKVESTHSEDLIWHELGKRGTEFRDYKILEIYSERKPCLKCMPRIEEYRRAAIRRGDEAPKIYWTIAQNYKGKRKSLEGYYGLGE